MVHGRQLQKAVVMASAVLAGATVLPAYASTMVLEFSGTLASIYKLGVDSTNDATVGQTVNGRFKIGMDSIPSNSSFYPSQGVYQSTSASWITTEIDGFGFDVARGMAENPGGSYVDLVNKVNNSPFVGGLDGLNVRDDYFFGSCTGSANFCANFSLEGPAASNVVYFHPDTFSDIQLPFELDLLNGDFLTPNGDPTEGQVTFKYLAKFDGVYQYAVGNIALNKLTASVAPVPLPAAAWMFLTAMGGLAGLKLRKRRCADLV